MRIRKIVILSFLLIIISGILMGCGQKELTISFDTDGGLLKGVSVYKATINDKEELELLVPEKNGYLFKGWQIGETIWDEGVKKFESDITIKALWEIQKYQINYSLEGGTLVNQIEEYTVEDAVALPIPTKEGSTFEGWLCEGQNIKNISVGTTGDLNLIAKWNNIQYQILYNLDGGIIQNEYTTSFTVDDEVSLPIPTKNDYEFIGWYSNPDFDGERLTTIAKGTCGNVDLYASWVPEAAAHSITYYPNGGIMPDNSQDVYREGMSFTFPTPTREGYKFIGWYSNPELTGIKVVRVKNTDKKDFVLYAKWEKLPTISNIEYVLNNGTLPSNSITTYTEGTITILPTPIKEGYEFVGWFYQEDFRDDYFSILGMNVTGNLKLYAGWTSYNGTQFTITYNLNGGALNGTYAQKYDKGSYIVLPVPTKDNFMFAGWYENSDFSGNEIKRIYPIEEGNKTYYANWENLKDVVDSLIPNKVSSNLTFFDTYPDNPDLKLSWISLNPNIISNTGIINQSHKTLEATIQITLSSNGHSGTYQKTVSVTPVVYDSLNMGDTVIGYLYASSMSHWGTTDFNKIFSSTALNTLDVVNYGFATVSSTGHLVLENENFTKYLSQALELRKYGIRVTLCIGENSRYFSDMALTSSGINTFVKEVMEVVEKYHFDGVDIDWEFPGVGTSHDVSVDRPNFTNLIKALRTALDSSQEAGGTKYLLTAAIPGTSWGSERYELSKLNNLLDYINMMSYDLNNENTACHHTNLYNSTQAKGFNFSVDYGVKRFVSLGFSKNKIVAGMAFYGKYYKGASTLGASATFNKNITYTLISAGYLGGNYQQLWDDVAKAPYILNTITNEYISYDNERSIGEKIKYSKNNGLQGVMFWDYSEDTTGTLIKAIYDATN